MPKNFLTGTEFAINENAIFRVDRTTRLKINKNGTITITYKLADFRNLQVGTVGSNDRIKFDRCGVLKFDNIADGQVDDLNLVIIDNTNILLRSFSLGIDLTTDGEKGEHGLTLTSEEEK